MTWLTGGFSKKITLSPFAVDKRLLQLLNQRITTDHSNDFAEIRSNSQVPHLNKVLL